MQISAKMVTLIKLFAILHNSAAERACEVKAYFKEYFLHYQCNFMKQEQ